MWPGSRSSWPLWISKRPREAKTFWAVFMIFHQSICKKSNNKKAVTKSENKCLLVSQIQFYIWFQSEKCILIRIFKTQILSQTFLIRENCSTSVLVWLRHKMRNDTSWPQPNPINDWSRVIFFFDWCIFRIENWLKRCEDWELP